MSNMHMVGIALVSGVALTTGLRPHASGRSQEMDDLTRDMTLLTTRLREVEARLANAERSQAPGTVTAPFHVVNSAGKTVFIVYTDSSGSGSFALADGTGKHMVAGVARSTGGFLRTNGPGTAPNVVMASLADYAGISIRNASDQSRLGFVLAKGVPHLSMTNEKHVTVVSLHQVPSGSGQLELGDASGNAQVRIGVTSGGCGRVETFPERPARMMGGLASFILGGGC